MQLKEYQQRALATIRGYLERLAELRRKVEKLKNLAFTLDMARSLPKLKEGKRRLVFAPTKYLDQQFLDELRIDFAQLPFEIYERFGRLTALSEVEGLAK